MRPQSGEAPTLNKYRLLTARVSRARPLPPGRGEVPAGAGPAGHEPSPAPPTPPRARALARAEENVAQVHKWNVGGVREREGVCARARARARPGEGDGVPAAPSIARRNRGPAAPPPAWPSPGPARPPPPMELSAIGEQVFAVESIRKKRVRKVRLPGGGSQDPCGVPSCSHQRPLHTGGERECGAEAPGSPAPPGSSPQLVPQFPPAPCRASRIKVVTPGCWEPLSLGSDFRNPERHPSSPPPPPF